VSSKEWRREWYRKNRSRIRAERKAYYQLNKEQINARAKASRHLNRDRERNAKLRKAYGITLSEFLCMLENQGGCCYICRRLEEKSSRGRLCVDHDHKTGKVRKLLCHSCNRALGLLNEDKETIERLALYLQEHAS
jgi:hypothetical protein